MLLALGSALLGCYLTFVVVSSLRTGVFRYKSRTHRKTEEPKTFWMGVIWFAVLAVVLFVYAAMEWRQLR